MKIKAFNIYKCGSSKAPKEWEQIPLIKLAMPSPIGQEISLQRIDGTNLCIWYTRKSVWWNPVGDPFYVEENNGQNERKT